MIGNLSAVFIYSMYRERIRVDACHTAIIKAMTQAMNIVYHPPCSNLERLPTRKRHSIVPKNTAKEMQDHDGKCRRRYNVINAVVISIVMVMASP